MPSAARANVALGLGRLLFGLAGDRRQAKREDKLRLDEIARQDRIRADDRAFQTNLNTQQNAREDARSLASLLGSGKFARTDNAQQGFDIMGAAAGPASMGLGQMLMKPDVEIGGVGLSRVPEKPDVFDPATDVDVQRTKYMIDKGLMRNPNRSEGPSVSEQIALANLLRGQQNDARSRAEAKVGRLLASGRTLNDVVADPEIAGVMKPDEVVGIWQGGLKKAQPRQPALSATEREKLRELQASANTIDAALRAIEDNPDAVGGFKNIFLPKLLTQKIDIEGIPGRAAVADVGSQVRQARSGQAVSDAEMDVIKPFIPSTNDSAEEAQAKLVHLRARFRDKLSAYGVKLPDYVPRKKLGGVTAPVERNYRPENPF